MKTFFFTLNLKSSITALVIFAGLTTNSIIASEDNSDTFFGQELGCLAMNIYHEARGETQQGKMAVAAVTMNRIENKHYPNTACEVVWQRKQFSWTDLKVKYHLIKDVKAWGDALDIAQYFMQGENWSGVGKATHYHATSVSPNWKDDNQLIAKVGNHLFYDL